MRTIPYGPGSLCLLCNPVAGTGKAAKALEEVKSLLQQAGVRYTVKETQYPGHGTELARQAAREGYTTLCALGGDGSVR